MAASSFLTASALSAVFVGGVVVAGTTVGVFTAGTTVGVLQVLHPSAWPTVIVVSLGAQSHDGLGATGAGLSSNKPVTSKLSKLISKPFVSLSLLPDPAVFTLIPEVILSMREAVSPLVWFIRLEMVAVMGLDAAERSLAACVDLGDVKSMTLFSPPLPSVNETGAEEPVPILGVKVDVKPPDLGRVASTGFVASPYSLMVLRWT